MKEVPVRHPTLDFEMDRAGLLFFYLYDERTKDNGNLYFEEQS